MEMKKDFVNLLSTYQVDQASFKYLNSNLALMVTQPDGFHSVDIEDDKEVLGMMRRMISCVFGKKAGDHIVISGSVSQGLKCDHPNNRGDVDVLAISDYPEIKVHDQKLHLVEQSELGFFRIKGELSKYPVVNRNGEYYLSASSLRNLEPVWWPAAIKIAFIIMDKQQELYHFFHKYDKPQTGVASNIAWSSNLTDVHRNEVYFQICQDSYMQNLFHLLAKPEQAYAKKTLDLVRNFLAISRIFANVDILMGKEIMQHIQVDTDESGMFMTALYQLLTMKNHGKPFDSVIDHRLLDCFKKVCHFFDYTVSSKINTDEKRKHRETIIKTKGFIDVVPAIRCEGFPEQAAADWSKRVANKNWPENRITDEVLKGGFHLVPKTSMWEDADADVDFRVSFSTSETILAQSLSRFHKECYRIFKMYYYEHLKSEPAVLESYHLKTVFFWLLEEIQPKFWCEENRASIFYLLMNKLLNHLKERKLPHYFIPQHNLFQYLDGEKLDRLAEAVSSIMEDPINKMGPKIKEVMEYYKLKNQARREKRYLRFNVIDEELVKEQRLIREVAFQTLEDLVAAEKEFEIQGIALNSEEVNALLADRRARSLLTFCFDVTYGKHALMKIDHSSEDNRGKLLHGPDAAIFIHFTFPLIDGIVREVFTDWYGGRLDNDSQIIKQISEWLDLGTALSDNSNDWTNALLKIGEILSGVKIGLPVTSDLMRNISQIEGQILNGSLDTQQTAESLADISRLFTSGFSIKDSAEEKGQIVDDIDLD